MTWQNEATELLRQLWAQGMSASMIANELHKLFGMDVSRNAVIGKAHRMKLSPHKVTKFQARPRPSRPRRVLLVIAQETVSEVIVAPLRRKTKPPLGSLTVHDLND